MLKRIWCLFAIISSVLFLTTGCISIANSDESTTGTDPLADGVLTVAVDDTGVPMEFRDNENNLVGFDIDLIEELGKVLGVETDIKVVDWDGIFTGLTAGQFDVIISSTSITPERQQAYSQSDPYISNGIVIVKRTDDPTEITSFEDLDGKVVGVELETSSDYALTRVAEENDIDADIRRYDNMLDIYAALEGQQIDYIVADIGFSRYYVQQKPEVFTIATDTLSNEPIGVTAAKQNTELIEKINEALDVLRENGTLAKISEKWYGSDMTSDIDTNIDVIE